MPSNRFAEGKIGTVYLTSDGLQTGTGCKLQVEGNEQFASDYAATHQTAADGTVHTQTINLGKKGKRFAFVIDYIPESVMNSIKTTLNTALASGSTVAVEVTDYISFTVNSQSVFQSGQLYTWESRSGGILKGVRIEFIAVS